MVVNFRSPRSFQPFSCRWRKGLARAKHPLDTQASRIHSHFLGLLCHVETVGWSVQEPCCLYLADLADSSLRIKRSARHDHTANFFGRIVTFPKSHVHIVSKRNENAVRLSETRHP